MKTNRQKNATGEEVQVEVSLDTRTDHYAVMVSDRATNTIQSVVAIPKDECSRRRSRLLQQSRYSQLTGRMTPQVLDHSDRRRADLMRNLSPINNERSSVFDADHHDRRKLVQSLPPPTDRSIHNSTIDRRRESSCAPKLGSRPSSFSEIVNHQACHVEKMSKKPNLVAAASKRGFFRSIRPSGRKIHNESK
jgi:hypothetical protein